MSKIILLLTMVLFMFVRIVPLQAQTTNVQTAINKENAYELVEFASLPVKGLARVAWSPSGDALAVADATSVRIYDPQTFKLKRELPGYGDMLDLVYSPDGAYLAVAAGIDKTHGETIGLIKTDALDGIYILVSQAAGSLSFSADSQFIAFVNEDGYINIYDVKTRALNHILPFTVEHATGLAFDPNNTEVAIGDMIGNIQLWDIKKQALVGALNAERIPGGGGGSGFPWEPRDTVVYSPDGQYIVSGSTQWTHPLHLWDRAASHAVAILQREGLIGQGANGDLVFNSASFSTDGTLLVTTAGDPQLPNAVVDVWDVQAALQEGIEMRDIFPGGELVTREPLVSLSQPGVTIAVFNPDNTFLAAAGSSVIKVWGLSG